MVPALTAALTSLITPALPAEPPVQTQVQEQVFLFLSSVLGVSARAGQGQEPGSAKPALSAGKVGSHEVFPPRELGVNEKRWGKVACVPTRTAR